MFYKVENFDVQKILNKNSIEILSQFHRYEFEWMYGGYNSFNDLEKYLIFCYYVKNNYVEKNKNTVKKNMVLLNNFIITSINLINSH